MRCTPRIDWSRGLAGVQTFLVGESFMREHEPGVALQRLFAA